MDSFTLSVVWRYVRGYCKPRWSRREKWSIKALNIDRKEQYDGRKWHYPLLYYETAENRRRWHCTCVSFSWSGFKHLLIGLYNSTGCHSSISSHPFINSQHPSVLCRGANRSQIQIPKKYVKLTPKLSSASSMLHQPTDSWQTLSNLCWLWKTFK